MYDNVSIVVERRQTGVGDAIELLAALGFDGRVANLFKPEPNLRPPKAPAITGALIR